MPAFRLFSRLNTFYGLTGQLLAGGQLKFYDAGTTTPRNVYGDPDLTINNGSTVDLDSSGRPDVDVWGEGSYFVEAYDALGVKQGEADYVQIPGAGGQTIPALETGKFLTNNGAVLLWTTIREVPDPTGQSGKVLGTDGEALLWQDLPAIPEPPEPDQDIGTTSFRFGNFLIQCGNDTAPTSSSRTTSKNITFPTAYTSLLHVAVMPTVSAVGSYGIGATVAVTGFSAGSASTGVTATFNSADDGGDSGYQITNTIPFTWIAFGLIAA